MKMEDAGIQGIQVLDPIDRLIHRLSYNEHRMVLLNGRCIGSVSVSPNPESGLWGWSCPSESGGAKNFSDAITTLIEQDYWNSRDSNAKKEKQGPTEDEIKIRTLEQTVERLQVDRDEWRTAEANVRSASQQEIGALKAQIEELQKQPKRTAGDLTFAYIQLQEKLEKTQEDRNVYAVHAGKLQDELAQARELLTEQGGMLAKQKDQITALERLPVEVSLKQEILSLLTIIGKLQSDLKKAETDREHWCNMASVLQKHTNRGYWLGQESGFNQAKMLISNASRLDGVSHEKIANIINMIDGWREQALDNAKQKRPMPTIISSDAAFLLESSEQIGKPNTTPPPATGEETDDLRNQLDFMTWSAARLANIVRGLWSTLSSEETSTPRGLLSTQANSRIAEFCEDDMRRNSDGRLIINWKKVLDPDHYGGILSPASKSFLESLWMTT